jgi:HK97 family phage prohead protease
MSSSEETMTAEEIEERGGGRAIGQFRGELRALDDSEGPVIEGYAAVFNKLSQPLEWGYRERIMPGAFAKTIKDGDIRALFNHDPNHVLGRNKAGTLDLREDETGLHFTARPPDEPWVRALIASIRRGDIDQASFAFQPVQEDWSKNQKQPIRNVREVRLFDVSPVTFPAYIDTIVQARTQSLADVLRSLEPAASHSEAPEERAGEEPPEPVKVRPMDTLVKEWRLAKEQGISVPGKDYGGENND